MFFTLLYRKLYNKISYWQHSFWITLYVSEDFMPGYEIILPLDMKGKTPCVMSGNFYTSLRKSWYQRREHLCEGEGPE